jgi:hypothetical protein
MLMKNTKPHPIKIEADLIDDWGDSTGARPSMVTVPPGGVVSIRDEYALRSVPGHAPRDPDTGAPLTSSIVESRAVKLSGGALAPATPEAEQMYSTKFHGDLPSVKRKLADDAKRQRKEAGERWVTRDQAEAEIAEQVKRALDERASQLPIEPPAAPKLFNT